MSQNLAEISAFRSQELSLVDGLMELEKYGNPSLSKDHNEWYCGIDVFVTGEGTSFKVRSDFKHKTHTDAVNLCYLRLMAELQRIKET